MPQWVTPTAVHSKCGEEANHPATDSIDNVLNTYWGHKVNELHWIKYDLGETRTITKVRVYPIQIDFDSFDVYVSDNPDSWGTAVATGCYAASNDWAEIDCTEKDGRYVYLKDIDSSYPFNYVYFGEFDAYCAIDAVPRSYGFIFG